MARNALLPELAADLGAHRLGADRLREVARRRAPRSSAWRDRVAGGLGVVGVGARLGHPGPDHELVGAAEALDLGAVDALPVERRCGARRRRPASWLWTCTSVPPVNSML